jgi:hypothetical protein
MGKLLEKIILKIVQRHNEERGLLNASQFCFHAHHSMTLQCMRLMDVTLNFHYNMCVAVVFLDIEKSFDKTWHLGLLYILFKLKFSISLNKLISSFLSQRKFRVLVEGEMSIPRDIQARMPQGSVLSPTLYSIYIYIYIYINDMAQTPGVCLGLFADDYCIYMRDCKEGYVLQKLQQGLSAIEMWCE